VELQVIAKTSAMLRSTVGLEEVKLLSQQLLHGFLQIQVVTKTLARAQA